MKTHSVKSDKLILWKPFNEGETIYGKYDGSFEGENGHCFIIESGGLKIAVPVTNLLEETFEKLKGISEASEENPYLLCVYMGRKQGSTKGHSPYKVFSSHILEPETEDETEFLSTLEFHTNENLIVEEEGTFSDVNFDSKEVSKIFDVLEFDSANIKDNLLLESNE